MWSSRRRFVTGSIASSAALLIQGCARPAAPAGGLTSGSAANKKDDDQEVGAVEDLMREHGVMRRALVVYREAAARLRSRGDVPPDALRKTAMLFRAFGEDYHEKKLEEAFIFPAVKRAGGPAGAIVDVLAAQHQRGRELTDFVVATTAGAKMGANAETVATVLESIGRMYETHAAREDTIVFPAWKATMSEKQLDEIGERFEEIEHEQLGQHGFEDAVKQIAAIEEALGLADVARFTAPPAPKVG